MQQKKATNKKEPVAVVSYDFLLLIALLLFQYEQVIGQSESGYYLVKSVYKGLFFW